MSKRALTKYLKELDKEDLEDQILDLYGRFKEVKTFYDFVFNPKEDKLIEECKVKISKEYFPTSKRRPKLRRSVAKKYIKHFKQIGLDPMKLADIMLYNLEVAQSFSSFKEVKQDAFYKSMLGSFQEVTEYLEQEGLMHLLKERLVSITQEVNRQNWPNAHLFY